MSSKNIIITRKKGALKGEDGHRVFSIRIRDDTVKRLDDIAIETNRSRNELINLFLDFAIKNCVIED